MKPTWFVLVFIACACAGISRDPVCPDASVSIASVTGPPMTPATADVTLHVTLERSDGITIEKAFVAGVAATSTADNFGAFDVTIPIGVLQSLPSTNGAVSVEVTLVTTCETSVMLVDSPMLSILVAPRSVGMLTIDVGSGSAGYLPATLAVSAPVTISSGSASAGAAVTVDTSLGQLEGSASIALILDASGSAMTSLAPDPAGKQGTAVLHARSGTIDATPQAVTFIGPPQFLPPSGTLAVNPTPVAVQLDPHGGTLASCSAIATPGIAVTATATGSGCSGTADLVAGAPLPAIAPGCAITITIDTHAATGSNEGVTLSCDDVYHQVGTATFASH